MFFSSNISWKLNNMHACIYGIDIIAIPIVHLEKRLIFSFSMNFFLSFTVLIYTHTLTHIPTHTQTQTHAPPHSHPPYTPHLSWLELCSSRYQDLAAQPSRSDKRDCRAVRSEQRRWRWRWRRRRRRWRWRRRRRLVSATQQLHHVNSFMPTVSPVLQGYSYGGGPSCR